MEYRTLGKTSQPLSVIGFGGIVVSETSPDEASRLVASAVTRGVNYFDVAPSYGDAEAKLGPALKPYRNDVFLACKTQCRDAEGATAELEASLKMMHTDHFDLYQLHAMTKMDDVEKVLGPGGALEAFQRARASGKVRFLGFSAHSAEVAEALLDRFPFDSVLFPLNFATYLEGNFGPQVVAAAQRHGTGILALKGMARTRWPEGTAREDRRWRKAWYEPLDDRALATLALRFTLGLGVTAAIPPGHAELFDLALEIAQDLRPLSETELTTITEMARATEPLFRAA
jgi:aryl-alcohol dehydrogenase-like predicted oxidoreductase